MIIGFDGSRAFTKDRTGTENYSYQILLNLAKIDTENSYKVYVRPGSKIEGEWPINFKFIQINFNRLWTQAGLGLRTLFDPMDVLFVPSHTVPLFRRPGLKTVMTVHDLGAEYLPDLHQLKQTLYLKWITNFQLKSTTKLIAVSEATKKDLIKKVGIDPKKIKVIYEGVDTEIFKPVKSDIERDVLNKYDLEKEKYFLFVGTIQPRKNLGNLIQAFAEFLKINSSTYSQEEIENLINEPNPEAKKKKLYSTTLYKPEAGLKLVIAGGKGWKSDDIYSLPESLKIKDSVRFLGRVDDKDLPALYSGSLAFVFPSLFEGFGLPVLEAMACETAVLTSNTSSLPEVAGDAAVLVNPNNETDIQRGLMLLLDSSLRKSLIDKGSKRVRLFNWQGTSKEVLNLLKGVVNEKS